MNTTDRNIVILVFVFKFDKRERKGEQVKYNVIDVV